MDCFLHGKMRFGHAPNIYYFMISNMLYKRAFFFNEINVL